MSGVTFREVFEKATGECLHTPTSVVWHAQGGRSRGRKVLHVNTSAVNQPLILVVRSDPKPLDHISLYHGQRTKIAAHACGPKVSDSLEMKRRMARVTQPQFEILSGQLANLRRNVPKALTKAWGRRGLHQVGPLADRPRPPLDGCKALRVFRCARALRFAGPTPRNRACSIGATTRETPLAGASQWPLRFPRACSRGEGSFNGAALASAAPLKRIGTARNRGLHPFLSFNGNPVAGFSSNYWAALPLKDQLKVVEEMCRLAARLALPDAIMPEQITGEPRDKEMSDE